MRPYQIDPPSKKRGDITGEAGQASVFVLVTIGIMLLTALLLYDTGRLTTTRMHLQNTADSSVYSGAVMLARAYNFSSYVNRAMTANQVAVAQMVGLASWSRYYCDIYSLDDTCTEGGVDFPADGTADEIEALLALFEPGQPGDTFLDAYSTIGESLDSGLGAILPGIVTALNAVITGESAASTAYYLATIANLSAGLATPPSGISHVPPLGIIAAVLKANDPKAQVSIFGLGTLGTSIAETADFTHIYKPSTYSPLDAALPDPIATADPVDSGHANSRFHDVVTNSLDSFSANRTSHEIPPFSSLFLSAGDCFDLGVGFMLVNDLEYKGSTSLSSDNSAWTAKDVNYGYLGSGVCGIVVDIDGVPIGIFVPIIVPLPPSMPGEAFTGNEGSAVAAGIAGPGAEEPVGTYSGLAPYLGVADITNPDMSSPAITLFIDQPETSVMTTEQLNKSGNMPIADGGNGTSGTSIDLADDEAGHEIQVGASADAYFSRPLSESTLGKSIVYGNMFNPYWEAHLIPISPAVKAAAAAAQMATP